MMKLLIKQKILLIFMLVGFSHIAVGQNWYVFQGHITNIDSISTVSNYPVFVDVAGNQSIVMLTDEFGFYNDSIYVDTFELEMAVVSVYDCFSELHFQIFEPPLQINEANFEICVMPTECQAFFYYDYDIVNQNVINFFDLSGGNINKWTWDFGDGNISNLTNPTHEYDEEGEYQVLLVVEDTNGFCWSAYDEFIIIGNADNCEASFAYESLPANPLQIQFMDLSMGSIEQWMWDFGDGNINTTQNPLHTYNSPGVYEVCLFVYDNMFFCSDSICMQIIIPDSTNCTADFTAILDTLNTVPHTFLFTDNSSVQADNWYWDFGDGNYSELQHPIHTYETNGSYEVCLTIYSDEFGVQCSSTKCENITSLDYYNFGGHAFLGDFPMNIEEDDSSNIAIAYLYRRFNNQWKYIDEREFWKFGYYWFVEKPVGDYLIRVDLKSTSVDYNNYAPSYYGNNYNWQYAASFELSNDDQFTTNIVLKSVSATASGVGIIEGYIYQGITCYNDFEIEGQLIILYDGDGNYLSYTYTNESGEFEFISLANGSYKVQAEITGKLSTTVSSVISSDNPFSDDNLLEINCDAFVSINDLQESKNTVELISVFPVPAKNIINFKLLSSIEESIKIEMYDSFGRVMKSDHYYLNEGQYNIKMDLSSLNAGIYIFKIYSSNSLIQCDKIVVSD